MDVPQKIVAQLYRDQLPSFIRPHEFMRSIVDKLRVWMRNEDSEWIDLTHASGITCPVRSGYVLSVEPEGELMFERLTGKRRRGKKESEIDYALDCAYWKGRWESEKRPNPDLTLIRCAGCSDLRLYIKTMGWSDGSQAYLANKK